MGDDLMPVVIGTCRCIGCGQIHGVEDPCQPHMTGDYTGVPQ